MTGRTPAERRALRLHELVLRLFPPDFRDEYGRELRLLFLDRWRVERSRWARLRLWAGIVGAACVDAPATRVSTMRLDLRDAGRRLRQDRTTTVAVVVVLALGIGWATLIFSLANGLLLRSLPYAQPDRLVAIDEFSPTDPSEQGTVSIPNFADLGRGATLFAGLGLYAGSETDIRGTGVAEHVRVGSMSAGTAALLGIQPILGHLFTVAEDAPTGPKVVLLSEAVWRERFSADPQILSRTLDTGNAVYAIVGVMPAGFSFPDRAQLWFPLHADPASASRTDYNLQSIGRLKRGVSPAQASAELAALLQSIHRAHPESDNNWSIRARPYRDYLTTTYRAGVRILMAAVGLLLVMGCTNVSNLLLARSTSRSRELAVRRAMGATVRRLVRLLLTEAALLGLLGGAGGVLLAYLGVPVLLHLVPIQLPQWLDFSVDGRVLGFALAVSLGTALLAGLAPSLGLRRGTVTMDLRDGGRTGTADRSRQRWRHGLVVAGMSLSTVLLVGAGLAGRSFLALRFQPLGFDTTHVLSLNVDYPHQRYPDGPKARTLLHDLGAAIGAVPGVTSYAFGTGIPLDDGWTRIFTVEGHDVPLEQMPFVNHVLVTPGYLRTLGITLIRGRDFTDADFDAPNVLIVSRDFVTQFVPGDNPLGRRIRFGPPAAKGPWTTIIGVAGETKHGDLTHDDRPTVYLPFGAFDGMIPTSMIVRTTTDPAAAAATVRTRIVDLDRDIAVTDLRTMTAVADEAAWQERFVAWLVGVFAVMAVLLISVGLYGVLSYAVSVQAREVGIRMALGAPASSVRRLFVRQGLLLAGLGLALGLGAGRVLSQLIRSELFDVSPADPVTYVGAFGLLTIVALVASTVPAVRATKVDPLVAMRQE